MSKIFSIDPQTGNNYQGDEQTVTNVNKKKLILWKDYDLKNNFSFFEKMLL